MNLKELSLPIKIYWDLSPALPESVPDVKTICEGIVEIRALGLDLLDTSNPLSKTCFAILERLKDQNISTTLTVSGSVLEDPLMGSLSRLKVGEVLVAISGKDDLPSLSEVVLRSNSWNISPGLSFDIDKENCRDIPDVVSFCVNNNINRLVFPMRRLSRRNDCPYISKAEGKDLSARLKGMKTDNMKITIHDPFLWRAFYPDTAFPGAGCQAANTMAYISPEAKVYPCPSMPIVLGDLREDGLRTVLSSALKKEVRRGLLDPPQDCLLCEELRLCMGGCRGRTFALTGSLSRRDPACF